MDEGQLFVKTGPASSLDMFEAEAAGLEELAAAAVIRVPRVHDVGLRDGGAFIAIEKLTFAPVRREDERKLGEQIAAMHRVTRDQFGWYRDNTCGPTPQINTLHDDWATFFSECRIGFQLDLAARNGYDLGVKGQTLLQRIPQLLEGHRPDASLLHGDLWGGNWANTDQGPAIFDPAVYYGDRETDLAMSRLFGGFGRGFYTAYEETWPLPPGHERRNDLYQLYHVLNHLNLFGSGYLRQSIGLMDRLLR